jgi:hypothetical protein
MFSLRLTTAAASLAALSFYAAGIGAVETHGLNDTARWLAGVETPVTGANQKGWDALARKRTPALRAFAERHLAKEQTCDTLFYPFSGPDMLNAVSLFPACKKYVLFGLEPVGELPDLGKLDDKSQAAVRADMDKAQIYLVARNYFVTQYMGRELRTPHLKGVLPLVSAMLVRTGYELHDVSWANTDGSPWDAASAASPHAMRLRFAKPGGPEQELFYASFDASNKGLKAHPGFLQFMAGVKPTATLIKSASYLLHDETFSTMRDLVEKSPVVVQDDTGLPYHRLLGRGYKVELYGDYTGVLPVFKYRYQPELARAYAALQPKEALQFPWSYMYRIGGVGLQIARKPEPGNDVVGTK